MNVVFLDIDGVLMPFPDHRQFPSGVAPLMFSEAALANLVFFLKYTDSRIVISSERRRMQEDINYLEQILEGLECGGRMIMVTPPNILNKETAIKRTLKSIGKKCNWVILDDNKINDSELNDKSLKVDPYIGLTKDDIYEAIRLLYKIPYHSINKDILNRFTNPVAEPAFATARVR